MGRASYSRTMAALALGEAALHHEPTGAIREAILCAAVELDAGSIAQRPAARVLAQLAILSDGDLARCSARALLAIRRELESSPSAESVPIPF